MSMSIDVIDVGDKAPDFVLEDHTGEQFSLSAQAGRSPSS